jgi:serine/threonine protein phosphatase PrpC
MGAFLSQPLTSKILQRRGNKYFKVGAGSMQGWRGEMEDAHTILLTLPNHEGVGFFGVYDGHCGNVASTYCDQNMWRYIDQLANFQDQHSIVQKVIECDQYFLENQICEDGTTAIFTLVEPVVQPDGVVTFKLTGANIGDSRIVLGKKMNDEFKTVALSWDHKPQDDIEQNRIEQAGGYVSMNRVRGNLALSRAIGDRAYKVPTDFPPDQRQVICVPDFITEEGVGENDFLILACDGIYEADIFTREQLVEWVAQKLKVTDDLALIVADLLDECKDRGSRDNMSAMIIQFTDGTSYHRDDEYVPGPYCVSSRHSKFQEAYKKFAEKAGVSVEQSRELFFKNNPGVEEIN